MKLFVFRLLWISLERPCRFLSHGSLAFRFPAPATVGVIFHKEFEHTASGGQMVSLPLWMPFSGCAALFKQERAASRLKKKQPKLKNLYFHGFTFRLLSVCINGLILI